MNVAFLGLGGNLGNRRANLELGLEHISKTCGEILLRSSIYETDAWGSLSKNKYLNMVVKIETKLAPIALMQALSAIESFFGRVRNADRNSDRNLDIDLLFYNQELLSSQDLEVPHPRLHLRKFVLIPLCEIEKSVWHPGLKKSAEQLLALCTDDLTVVACK